MRPKGTQTADTHGIGYIEGEMCSHGDAEIQESGIIGEKSLQPLESFADEVGACVVGKIQRGLRNRLPLTNPPTKLIAPS
jgi:hypothetical protein